MPIDQDTLVGTCARIIRQRTDLEPRLALILGSGLNALADAATDATVVETHDLPDYPRSTVEGHRGRLVLGRLEDLPVLFVQGRLHRYEGHDRATVSLPVHLAHALGATHVLITNAAGGIRAGFEPGTLMWIDDHIDWVEPNPFRPDDGQRPGAWARPTDGPWDREWLGRARDLATEAGIATETGTYLWTLGPSFETPAEIRAFATMGADAVGMSTVPEAVAAAERGLRVLGLSTITNLAAGLSGERLNHEEVLDTGRRVQERLTRLVHIVAQTVIH